MSENLKRGVFIVVIIGIFLIGIFIGRKMERKTHLIEPLEIQKELNWCKSILEKTFPPLPEEVHNIIGKVIEKGENYLLIESIVQVSRFPLPEGKEREKQEIKVKVNEETKIFKEEFVFPPPKPPESPIKEKVLTLNEIKVEAEVKISSKENIKGKKEILAQEIQLLTPSF